MNLLPRFPRLPRSAVLSVIIACCVTNALAQSPDRPRELLDMFLAGKAEEFVAAGTPQVQSGMPVEQLQVAMAQLKQVGGEVRKVNEVGRRTTDEALSVDFEVLCERSRIQLSVVTDAEDRLSGFWIRKVDPLNFADPPAYADATRFDERDIIVRTGEFELPGKLCVPKADALHPALVLVHGSGPHDADETIFSTKPFRDIAWGLASRGVAVLRYEKRTFKYGAEMSPTRITLEDETIDDALSAAALLREQPGIDPQRVFVLGHSLGGLAAPYIAARDPQLAGIIILAGSARPIDEVILDQLQYIAGIDGEISQEEKDKLDEVRVVIDRLRSGNYTDDDRLIGVPLAYWADIARRDPAAEAAKLKLPIFVIQCGRDYQVTMDCFRRWQNALGDKSNATLKVHERLNHLAVAGEGASTPQEYSKSANVDGALVEDIAAWIRR